MTGTKSERNVGIINPMPGAGTQAPRICLPCNERLSEFLWSLWHEKKWPSNSFPSLHCSLFSAHSRSFPKRDKREAVKINKLPHIETFNPTAHIPTPRHTAREAKRCHQEC